MNDRNKAQSAGLPGGTASHMGMSQGAYPAVAPARAVTAAGRGVVVAPDRVRRRIRDADEIADALALAAVTLQPDEVSGRRLIQRVMPQLYILRTKGHSFLQLTRVLNQAMGPGVAPLQVATVKTYYNEFIVGKLEECQKAMNEALAATKVIDDRVKAAGATGLIREATQLKETMRGSRQEGAASARLLGGGNSVQGNIGGEGLAPGGHRPGNLRPEDALHGTAFVEAGGPPTAGAEPPSAAGFGQMGDLPRVPAGRQSQIASPLSEAEGIPVAAPIPAPSGAGMERKNAGGPLRATGRGEKPVVAPTGYSDSEEPPIAQAIPSGPASLPDARHAAPNQGNAAGAAVQCLTEPTQDQCHPADAHVFDSVPAIFRTEAILEHPTISGLMLTKAQRMFNGRLKYAVNGADCTETVQQLANRLKWNAPMNATTSRTQGDFVALDKSALVKTSP